MKAIRLPLYLLFTAALWGCTGETSVTTREDEAPLNEPATVDEDANVSDRSASAAKPRDNTAAPTPPPDRTPPPTRPADRNEAREERLEPREPAARTDLPSRPTMAMHRVAAGTPLTVVMSSQVSTATHKEGDTFEATFAEPWSVDGRIVAERGDRVIGKVEEVVQPGRVKGRGELQLVLTEIFTGNKRYQIDTEPFVAIAIDNKERDAAVIAGGAGVGAVIGRIAGGKKGAAIGAIIGGGSGTATVLATKGQAMTIEPETKVNFVLDDAVELPILRNKDS